MNTQELNTKIKKLKELKVTAEELQAEITSIENDIKAEMAARDTAEMQVGIFKVRWTKVKIRKFDVKAFRLTHKDLYEQYSKTTENRRFSII